MADGTAGPGEVAAELQEAADAERAGEMLFEAWMTTIRDYKKRRSGLATSKTGAGQGSGGGSGDGGGVGQGRAASPTRTARGGGFFPTVEIEVHLLIPGAAASVLRVS